MQPFADSAYFLLQSIVAAKKSRFDFDFFYSSGHPCEKPNCFTFSRFKKNAKRL